MIKPYICMALTFCNRYWAGKQTQNGKLFSKPLLTWFSCLIFTLSHAHQAFAETIVPELSVLPWQLIGVDNEFATRNKTKLAALYQQLKQSLLTESQPLDQLLEKQGQILPLNLKHSIHPVASGKPTFSVPGPSYLVPVLCLAGESIVVATELVTLSDNALIASKQQFTPKTAWDSPAAPLAIGAPWAQDLAAAIRGADTEALAFKVDFTLLRSSHNSIEGTHECFNMLVAHELQKTMMVPTPLDLLEGYRLRQLLSPTSQPKRSTRTFLLDWGRDPKGPQLSALLRSSESVLGSQFTPRGSMTFELMPAENRISIPLTFTQTLKDFRSELLSNDKPQVAKIDRAWVYLDRGRAWGLDMNDRVYFEEGGRFVKGHVVGFYGAGLGLKSPRGFAIKEGAIVFVRKSQKQVKIGDVFDFDPTVFPTPWPAVRQPSKATH
ncbi:MAG: hypothetical protein H7249_19680 [Chitinophagaceae bacterium]|nr:hypothetical protein [Oligoflexus sp.]